jgi:phage terminase small subunit
MRPYANTMLESPLTAKQKAFCQEYLVDLNATRAAERAGYREHRRQGSNLIGLRNVRAEVKRLMDERSKRTEITADLVLQELLLIARSNLADAVGEDGKILGLREMPEEVQRVIAALEVKELFDNRRADRVASGQVTRMRFWDKLRALELLGKHLGLFTDKLELTGRDSGPVRVEMTMSEEQSRKFDEYLEGLRAGLKAPGSE